MIEGNTFRLAGSGLFGVYLELASAANISRGQTSREPKIMIVKNAVVQVLIVCVWYKKGNTYGVSWLHSSQQETGS